MPRPRALAFITGFDFIDLKQCRRYLLNELLAGHISALANTAAHSKTEREFIRELVAQIRGPKTRVG